MLKLRYQGNTQLPVEVAGLSPCALRDKTLAQIERRELLVGNQRVPLAELFAVSGEAGTDTLQLEGDLSGVHGIGARMSAGHLRVRGSVGRHAGSEMTGGHLEVHGSAGDFLGTEMRGGVITVAGDAGDLAGGAYRGSTRGMSGGTLLIRGNAGAEVGHSMRRGLLAVGGNCGPFAGVNMLAGTLLVFGRLGERAGAGMRRGTLVVLGSEPPQVLPTFSAGGLFQPLFMQLCLRALARHSFAVAREHFAATYRLYHGDRLYGGRGELLVSQTG